VNLIIQPSWVPIRTSNGVPTFVSSHDSENLLTNANANLDWADAPAGRYRDIPQGASTLYFALIGSKATDPDESQASQKIFFYFDRGPAMLVCTAVWTIGKQPCGVLPYAPHAPVVNGRWADTVVVSDAVYLSTAVAVDSGADRIGMIKVKTMGAKRVLTEFTSVGLGLSVLPVFTYCNE